MSTVAIIEESFGALTALLLGFWSYRYMNTFWRITFLQLVVYLIMVTLGYLLTFYQKSHGMERNNQWIYNISMFLEVGLLFLAAKQIINSKAFLIALFSMFTSAFAFNIALKKITVFAHYAYITAGICITILFCFVLYSSFYRFKTLKAQSPYLWFCAGLVIYFACTVPYFSVINFLDKNNPQLSKILFDLITDVLANVRYLTLAVAYWLVQRNAI